MSKKILTTFGDDFAFGNHKGWVAKLLLKLIDNGVRDLLVVRQRSVRNSDQQAFASGSITLFEIGKVGMSDENVSEVVLQALIVHFQLVQTFGYLVLKVSGFLLRKIRKVSVLRHPSS